MKKFKRFTCAALVALVALSFQSCKDEDPTVRKTIDFQSLELEAESYWNGSDESGGFTVEMATFNNDYNPDWAAWSGFSYSNMTDIETPDWGNQYSAYISGGGISSNNYVVSYVMGEVSSISFDYEVNLVAAKFTNSTYAYFSILNGDGYAEPFGNDDWFKLTVKGYDEENTLKGEVDFYLADFRSGKTTIIDNWTRVNLSVLSGITKVVFHLESSDFNEWGMNTPAYFCMDDLEVEHMN